MEQKMRAAVLMRNGPAAKAFEISECEVPVPGADEVLIEVETFGLNYADVLARKGIYRDAPPLPSVLGYEVVGKVVRPAENSQLKEGDRVLAFTRFGGYAEYAVAKEVATVRLPDGIPGAEAAALATQYCTAIYCAEWMANVKESETLLVHAAAGGVGHALIQIGQSKNCRIIGTAGSDKKIEYLKTIGVDLPVNYRKHNFQTYIEKELGKRPVDVVFDPVGGKTFRMSRKLMSKGSRLISFGISSVSDKKPGLFTQLGMAWNYGIIHPLEFLVQCQGVIGVNILHIADTKPHIIQSLLRESVQGYVSGKFKPKISWQGQAEEIARAHAMLEDRSSIGKIAVHWKNN